MRRGQAIERDHLIAVLQGQHVQTGEQLRRPGTLKREARDEHGQALLDDEGRPVLERVTGVAHVEMTMSVPKSVSVLWAMADEHDRQTIEMALLEAAERTVQYMAQNKAVVHRRGKDGVRVREPAAGAAVASSLHVTARRARGDRAPAPQLHVHNLVVGVVRTDGQLVAADSWEWFRHDAALEGGALFRVQVADALVKAGWAIRSGTGDRGRYFEVEGVPEALCEVMSPRSREVADARAKLERELGVRLHGGALAVLAKDTRQAKDHELDPERLQPGLGRPRPGARLRSRRWQPTPSGRGQDPRGRGADWPRRNRWCSPSCATRAQRSASLGLGRWCSRPPPGGCPPTRRPELLARMECSNGGELLALEGGRVTSREIRQLEQYVMDIAVRAAGKADGEAIGLSDREAGLRAAEAALGDGKRLDPEQLQAFELLTAGAGWVCLTGRAGTGKGPTLHAAAEAYRAAGWRVIACAMDGTTARRMADQLGGTTPALTVEQLKARLQTGAIRIDEHTAIFVDEASKLDTGHWAELASSGRPVRRPGARGRARRSARRDPPPRTVLRDAARTADPHSGAATDPPTPRP